MQNTILRIVIYSTFILLISCEHGSNESVDLDSYTPLGEGDVTQLIYMEDSSTISISIVDKIRREDGKAVYVSESIYGTQEPTISYYCISDGYLVATELNPIENDSIMLEINPFREQRLAKSHPEPGDNWLHTPGNPDSAYFIAEEIGVFPTLFGEVDEVYSFGLFHKNGSYPFLIVFYAKGLGQIGSSGFYFEPSEVQFMCSYKRISGKTYGELWPVKDYSIVRPAVNPQSIFILIQLLPIVIKY